MKRCTLFSFGLSSRSLPVALVLCSFAVFAAGCPADGSNNQPPTVVLSGAPGQTFVVGDQMRIQVDAQDPEGGKLEFEYDWKPKEYDWTIDDRATFLTFEKSAVFQWDPLASDASAENPLQIVFIVRDASGQETQKTVTVRIVPGNGQPVFKSSASQLYDPRTGQPLEITLEVTDNDSDQVQLAMDHDTAPVGSDFEQNGPFTGRFTWAPSPQQLERKVHSVRFTADDGDNPPVEHKVAIVVRKQGEIVIRGDQADQACPGEEIISHTPLGAQRTSGDPYVIEAKLSDPRFDRLTVNYTTTNAYAGQFSPDDEEAKLEEVDMVEEGGVWRAELPSQLDLIARDPDHSPTLSYQICAIAEGDQAEIVCAPSSGDQEMFHTFAIYGPDQEDCIDDTLDLSFGNDTIERATTVDESAWGYYRVCANNPDFHALQVRPGESYVISTVYNRGSDIEVKGWDDAGNPIALDTSSCTGMSLKEIAVPEGEPAQQFYIEVNGNNTTYQLRARKKEGGAAGCADEALEPNEDAFDATEVSDGEVVEGEICSGDDFDVYKIALQSGDALTVTHRFSNQLGNLDTTLFAPSQANEISKNGGVAFTAGFEDVEVLEHTAQESGHYYLLVFNNETSKNPYTLEFAVEAAPPCPDQDQFSSSEDNHTQGSAALIDSTDGLHEYTNLAVCPSKPDWYRRTDFEGVEVLGELVVTGGDGALDDVTFEVFDSQGNLITSAAPVGGTLSFDFVPSMTAAHFFKVTTARRVTYDFSLLR